MTFIPPWMRRLNGLTPLLEAVTAAELYDSSETLTVANEGSLVFGAIGAATTVTLTFEYVATNADDFILGVHLLYTGDAGAFQFTLDENGTFGAAVALTTGTYFMIPVPPSSLGNPYSVGIKALAANSGVAKTGTIAVCDRLNFAGDGLATRTLKTLTLSKTYNAPPP